MAKVASAWAFMEFWLASMFFSATGDVETREDGPPEIVGHILAVTSLGSIESLSARLDVITAGIDAYLPAMSEAFERLKIDIRKCAKERNRVVHAVWGTNTRFPTAVIRVETFDDKFTKYMPGDFVIIAQRIHEQTKKIEEFDKRCRELRFAELPREPDAPAR